VVTKAAIFAGDLFSLYRKYANWQGWRIEVLSENTGSTADTSEVIAAG